MAPNPLFCDTGTGHDSYRMRDEAMRLGATAYLRKPFDDQCLLDAIQLACEKGV